MASPYLTGTRDLPERHVLRGIARLGDLDAAQVRAERRALAGAR